MKVWFFFPPEYKYAPSALDSIFALYMRLFTLRGYSVGRVFQTNHHKSVAPYVDTATSTSTTWQKADFTKQFNMVLSYRWNPVFFQVERKRSRGDVYHQ